MSWDKEDLIAVMAAAKVGRKIPGESEGGWEERVDDAIARAERIWRHVLKADLADARVGVGERSPK